MNKNKHFLYNSIKSHLMSIMFTFWCIYTWQYTHPEERKKINKTIRSYTHFLENINWFQFFLIFLFLFHYRSSETISNTNQEQEQKKNLIKYNRKGKNEYKTLERFHQFRRVSTVLDFIKIYKIKKEEEK